MSVKPSIDRTPAIPGADLTGIALFVLLIALLAFRITRGADFGDESYYAIFIDDWLKGGIATSTFRVIHQTAALIVYPAALAFAGLTGSSDGLFLFLRVLFLIGAVTSALVWVALLKRLGQGLLAWAGGILVLSFVPFGLPAPSYNTLGLQALTIALASFGCAAFADRRNQEQFWWLVVSASAWAVATVAYPSMIVPVSGLCLLGLLYRDGSFPRPLLYLVLTVALVAAGWLLVALSLTPAHLYESFFYSSANFDPDGSRRRLALVRDTLAAHPAFLVLCLIATIAGLARRAFPLISQLVTMALVAGLFALAPTLFVRSHDAVTLLALTGLGLLCGLRADAGRKERIIGIVYATSLIAALTTCATAYNTVFNFSIGAMPAAALAIVNRPGSRLFDMASASSILAAIAAMLSTSLFFYYGELPGPSGSPRERMSGGIFSGLSLLPNDAAVLHLVKSRVNPLVEAKQSVATIGRFPGLVLAMPTRLCMPYPYSASPSSGDQIRAMTEDFYDRPGLQPSLVLIYRDAYFNPLNPISRFAERYESAAELGTPLGTLSIFRRR